MLAGSSARECLPAGLAQIWKGEMGVSSNGPLQVKGVLLNVPVTCYPAHFQRTSTSLQATRNAQAHCSRVRRRCRFGIWLSLAERGARQKCRRS